MAINSIYIYIIYNMPFLDFLFSPQAHKFRDGYNLNHDILMNVSEQARKKLIFYFIAQQVPNKLSHDDRAIYEQERFNSIGLGRTIWMAAALLGPLSYGLLKRNIKISDVRGVATHLLAGGLLSSLAVPVYSRVYEGRFVESSPVIQELAEKYNYGIYDFSVAKKEAHVLQVMYTMDAHYQTLHS